MQRAKVLLTGRLLATLVVALSAFCVTAADTHAAVIQRAPNNLGLVGYWSFDEGRGDVLGDMSGSGNDGTLAGGPQWTHGRANGALEFDGVDDYVNIGQVIDWSSGDYTVSVWFKLNSLTAQGDSPDRFRIFYGSSTHTFLDLNVGGSNFSLSGEVNINNQRWNLGDTGVGKDTDWHLLTLTFTDGSVSGYIDGNHFNTIDTSGVSQTIAINSLGRGYVGGSYGSAYGDFWLGKFDEFRIYNRTLSAAEVQSLYDSTKSTVVGVTPTDRYDEGLVAHWTFDGKHTTPTTVEDVVGSNDGTINGAVPTVGIVGQALEFGGGDYVQLPSSLENVLNGAPEASLSMWIKLNSDQNSAGNSGIIQLSGHTSSNGNLYYYTDSSRDGGIWLDIFRTNRVFTGDWQPTFPGTTWHNLAITTTPGANGWKMYLNGTLRYQTSGQAEVSAESSLFGGFRIGQNSGGRQLRGKVDDVRIYNRALSDAEITGLYSATKPNTLSSSSVEWLPYETGFVNDVSGWTSVGFSHPYTNPIVVVSGQGSADDGDAQEESRAMVRSVTSSGFEVNNYDDSGAEVVEDIGYIVMEAGRHTIDGVEVDAGTYTTSGSASTVNWSQPFGSSSVVVMDSIQDGVAHAYSSRYNEGSINSTGYAVYWESFDESVGESGDGGGLTAGYVAFRTDQNSENFEGGIATGCGADKSNNGWCSQTFSNAYSSTPLIFTNPISQSGGDPTITGHSNLSTVGVDLRAVEGDASDSEQAHAANNIPWIVWRNN